MISFACPNCANNVHFYNTVCLSCGTPLAYDPLANRFLAMPTEQNPAPADQPALVLCENASRNACNWLAQPGEQLCFACAHNRTIPNLGSDENVERWRRIETAKRYLFYSLLQWRLPVGEPGADGALMFEFLADDPQAKEHVLTGHENGNITLNIAEADDAERERRRTQMGEPFRTLLGHFRHEVGHYYWDRLVRDGNKLDSFREMFGDERADYQAALERHYREGPPADWQSAYISTYATSHPWEDFAETWAHYNHMIDATETAAAMGMLKSVSGQTDTTFVSPYHDSHFDQLVGAFSRLTVAVNEINRSLGQPDLYPFVLSSPVIEKLRYIDTLIASHRNPS